MANIKKISLAGAAAEITAATFTPSTERYPTDPTKYKGLYTFTTRDVHNFFPGAKVNITGVSTSWTSGPTSLSANLVNAVVYSVLNPTQFTVITSDWDWRAGITLYIPTLAMAYLVNGNLSTIDLVYAYPNIT
jgi:hypothetical protein